MPRPGSASIFRRLLERQDLDAVVIATSDHWHALMAVLPRMFDQAIKRAAPEHWAADGVHPTMAGHDLMAQTWLETVKP